MHIAHSDEPKFLSVQQLAKLVGLKRRQIAYLAKKDPIPGVVRANGYHYQYRLTPELLDWIKEKKSKVAARKRPALSRAPKLNSGIISPHGISEEFEIWLRRVRGLEGILEMEPEVQQEILDQFRPIARLYRDLAQRMGK